LSVEPNAVTRVTSGRVDETAELIIPLRGLAPTVTSQTTSELDLSIVRGHLRITTSVQTESWSSSRPAGAAGNP
jgi:hypothetical protein